jgi:hypothetical protein
MQASAGRPDNAAHVGCRDQHREDVAQPPHKIVAEFPAVVVFDEAQQAPVPDAPNDYVRAYVNTVQMSRRDARVDKTGLFACPRKIQMSVISNIELSVARRPPSPPKRRGD